MREPSPLPPRIAAQPFHVAEAKAVGVGEGRLRGPDLDRPFHGVRSAQSEPVLSKAPSNSHDAERKRQLDRVLTRCREYLPVLIVGQFFSHTTAARLFGCPLPADSYNDIVHVSTLSPLRAPRGNGVKGHAIQTPRSGVSHRYGLPSSDAASTWVALSTMLSLDELVVAADHLLVDPYLLDLGDPRPYVTLEELKRALASSRGRGSRVATSALLLARVGAESRMETLLRLLLQRSGLPEPELNPEVYSDAGNWLGRVDLFYPRYRTIVEYDGDGHRVDKATFERDVARREAFIAAGFAPIHVRSAGLFTHQGATVARVKASLAIGGWKPGR